jgi:protein SCO1/2
MKKTNYSYVGIAFIILVFGIYFVPRIIDRITSTDITRNESRSDFVNDKSKLSDLSFIEINGEPKKVPAFSFTDQNGKTITNKDYEGKVFVVEFFFTTCPTICPRMNANLIQIQNTFKEFSDFGVAAFNDRR